MIKGKILFTIVSRCYIRLNYNTKTNNICIYTTFGAKLKDEKIRDAARYKEAQLIMQRLKMNGCAICGYNKCNSALSFHHTNPQDKQIQVSGKLLQYSDKRIVGEIEKCILLCANCHREIHEKERYNAYS